MPNMIYNVLKIQDTEVLIAVNFQDLKPSTFTEADKAAFRAALDECATAIDAGSTEEGPLP